MGCLFFIIGFFCIVNGEFIVGLLFVIAGYLSELCNKGDGKNE